MKIHPPARSGIGRWRMENRGWHAWPALTSILHLSSSLFHLAAAEPAELVIRHANVITVDTNQPRAESFAVTAGRFVALGSDEKITPLIGPHTKVLDLKGKTVVPGFIDAHLHPRPIYPAD